MGRPPHGLGNTMRRAPGASRSIVLARDDPPSDEDAALRRHEYTASRIHDPAAGAAEAVLAHDVWVAGQSAPINADKLVRYE
jgi:hypothetical protein